MCQGLSPFLVALLCTALAFTGILCNIKAIYTRDELFRWFLMIIGHGTFAAAIATAARDPFWNRLTRFCHQHYQTHVVPPPEICVNKSTAELNYPRQKFSAPTKE